MNSVKSRLAVRLWKNDCKPVEPGKLTYVYYLVQYYVQVSYDFAFSGKLAMNVLQERRPSRPEQQPGVRRGVWSIGEVLAELLPQLAPPAAVRVEVAPIAPWSAGWRMVEVELASV